MPERRDSISGGERLLEARRLGTSCGPRKVSPVVFPPGRARLATSPSPTGSPITGTTRGGRLPDGTTSYRV
jgi:hypothetical protein